jgi:hypothetical protein
MAQTFDAYTTFNPRCNSCGGSPARESSLTFMYCSHGEPSAPILGRLARRALRLTAIAAPVVYLTVTVELRLPQSPQIFSKHYETAAPIGPWTTEVCLQHR